MQQAPSRSLFARLGEWHKRKPIIVHSVLGGLFAIALAVSAVVGTHTYARGGPSIAITAPTNGATVSGSSVPFAAFVSGLTPTSVNFIITVGKGTQSVPAGDAGGGSWTASFDSTSLGDGPWSMIAEATDGVTTVDSAPITFNISNAPPSPTITITAPTADQVASGSSFFLSATTAFGTATAEEFIISGAGSQTVAGNDAGSNTWTNNIDTTGLPDGAYSIVASSTINGLNVNSPSVNFTINNTPKVDITAPADSATISGSFDFTATISNATATSMSFQLTPSGGGTMQSFDASFVSKAGLWAATIPTTGLANGSYSVVAHAMVGLTPADSSPITVTVANAVPLVVTMTAPTDGSTVSGSVPLSATVSGGSPTGVNFVIINHNLGYSQTIAGSSGRGGWTASWNSTLVPNQVYSIHAIATAPDTSTFSSSAVSATVNNAGVAVFLLQPANGATLTSGGSILDPKVAMIAAVSGASASALSFVVSGFASPVQATFNGTTWSATLDPTLLPAGANTIIARATIGGSPVDSATTNVTVVHLPVPRITAPTDCATVTGIVPLKGTVSPAPDSVSFDVTTVNGPVVYGPFRATLNRVDGTWDATWNTAGVPTDTYFIRMLATKGSDTGRDAVAVGVNDTCRFLAPRGTFTLSVSMVSPQPQATISGVTPLLLSALPAAAKAGFYIYKHGEGVPTFVSASLSLSNWRYDWDTTGVANDTYSIQPIAWNGNDVSFLGTAITVTVDNQAPPVVLPTPTTTTEIPPLANLEFDPTATGTYSADVALAANPSIDVDLGIPTLAGPALCTPGSLIKLKDDNNPNTDADTAVYYCGADGKRYVFTNDKVYFSWYSDFSSVISISADTMANIPLGGDITYRPGSRMVKITTDPKVYAVSRGSLLRWVSTEAAAVRLYGADWNTKIDDISDAFFVNYTFGAAIK